jgi:hypothetical protein
MAPPEREAKQLFVIHSEYDGNAAPQPAYTLAQEKFRRARNFPLPLRRWLGFLRILTTCCAQVLLL